MLRMGSALAAAALLAACGRRRPADGSSGDAAVLVTAPSAVAPGAPRAGMAWIPSGVLRAGSAVDEAPRMADT